MMRLARNLVQRRELLWVLLVREFAGRYRQSLLGVGWAVVQPVGLTVLVVGLRALLAGAEVSVREGQAAYAAVLPWTFFANALIFATASVVRGGAMLRKIYFPREIFVIAAVLTSLVDFVIAACVLGVLMVAAGHPLTVQALWIPALLLPLAGLAVGVGLLTSACAVYKRDIVYAMPFLLQFWMFASPVWYLLDEVRAKLSPGLFRVYLLNPLVGVVSAFRQVLFEGRPPAAGPLIYAVAVTGVVLVLFYALFKRLEMNFADVV